MFNPIKIVDLNISPSMENIEDLRGLENYKRLKAFVRMDNKSIGFIHHNVTNGFVSREEIIKSIIETHSEKVLSINLAEKKKTISSENDSEFVEEEFPLITVAVCTRDRIDNLELCLASILNLEYPNFEIIVVDNAPSNNSTKNFIESFSNKIKYTCQPIPGLSRARNKAIKEASGEFIAFTDDDVVVDKSWLIELTKVFLEDQNIMAVTGLVIPYEIETYSQELFEIYGGFGRGFDRKRYYWATTNKEKASKYFGGTGKCGTGANMAFRKEIFNILGFFDQKLGVGTPTNGAEDLDFFFRIIKAGYPLIYEPNAVVRHRHRKSYHELKNQLRNNGIGLYSYITHALFNYKDDRYYFLYLAVWWFFYWDIKRLLLSFKQSEFFPRDLIIAELKGTFLGFFRYWKSRKTESRLAKKEKLLLNRKILRNKREPLNCI